MRRRHHDPTLPPPTFQFARLALEEATQQEQQQQQAAATAASAARTQTASQQQPSSTDHPFYVPLGPHKLGAVCGPYLISCLMQLPPDHRAEILSSLGAWAMHTSDSKEAHALKARLEHTLRNQHHLGGSSKNPTTTALPLTPTYAPFHARDPAWALFKTLPFPCRALVEYYLTQEMLVSAKAAGVLKDVHRSGGLAPAEAVLARFVGKEAPEGLAEAFASSSSGGQVVDWGVRLTLDKDSGTGFVVKHLGPMGIRGSSTFMHRTVGLDRFMRVHLSNRRHWWSERGRLALATLAQEGLPFAGRRYKYLNHKADGNGVCYFLAEDSMGRETPKFKPLLAQQAVASLGNFFNFPSVPRLVARVALAFSRSQALPLEPRQIELIDDVQAPEDGAVMTDGSGFIAPDLVARLPPHVFQGRALSVPWIGPGQQATPYAVVQVRVLCHLGGFKGTLLVHPQLCNKIQLRRSSMLKFPAPSPSVTPLARRPSLDVLTTFCVLKATTRLSRELMLVLRALDVPENVFLQLMEEEVTLLEAARHDTKQALALLQRSSATLIQGSPEWQANAMLRARHTVDEPYVRKTVQGLRSRALTKLQQGRVLCPSSLYIVGQPDPLGVLQPNEVFLSHGLPAGHAGLPDQGTANGVYEGRVLIARHPIHNPAHMQAFTAVKQPALQAFVGPRAGVLFFSTQGTPSPASKLSNGDMDGDVYFVCLHPAILATACPLDEEEACAAATAAASSSSSPPCPGSELLTKVGPFAYNNESVGHQVDTAVMRRCLESCVAQAKANDIVASACDWWLKHADVRGARSTNCLLLGMIAAQALDSAKTGQLWSLPTVLKPAHRPTYLARNRSTAQARSTSALLGYAPDVNSLLGRIHARVSPLMVGGEEKKASAPLTSSTGRFAPMAPVRLDPDLRVEGAAAFLEQAQSWVKAYKQSFSRRMGRRCFAQQQQRNDDPGEYQALKAEVLLPFQQVFEATVRKGVEEGGGRQPLQLLGGNGTTLRGGSVERKEEKEGEGGGKAVLEAQRLALASALYEVTYMSGSTLSLPWDMALSELNRVKERAVLARKAKEEKEEKKEEEEKEVSTTAVLPAPPPRPTFDLVSYFDD